MYAGVNIYTIKTSYCHANIRNTVGWLSFEDIEFRGLAKIYLNRIFVNKIWGMSK